MKISLYALVPSLLYQHIKPKLENIENGKHIFLKLEPNHIMDHELPKMYLLMHTKCVTRDWKTHICNLYISYLYLLHFFFNTSPKWP